MANDSPIVLPGNSSGASGQSVDLITPIAVILPFLLLIYVLSWGSKRKERKKRVIEASYNLIALDLLLLVILPACAKALSCGFVVLIPLIMFLLLVLFVFTRSKREAEHEMRLLKAVKDGHLRPVDLMRGGLEEEIRKAEVTGKKAKKEVPKPEPVEKKPAVPVKSQPPPPKWWVVKKVEPRVESKEEPAKQEEKLPETPVEKEKPKEEPKKSDLNHEEIESVITKVLEKKQQEKETEQTKQTTL